MSEKKYYGNTKKTTEQFIEEAKKIHGNKFDYSKVDYKNANTKVCIICPEHGEFFQRPISHLRGDKCPSCSGNKKLTSEQFIKKSNEIHNNKFDYSKVDYKNNSTKVCIICPEHGEFWQTPNSHLSGKGCPKCGYIKITNKNTKWDYEKCYELAQKCKSKKEFREKYPKTISFKGALGYTKNQNYVEIVTAPENQNKRSLFDCFFESDFLTFEFSQIIGIERTTTRTYKNY